MQWETLVACVWTAWCLWDSWHCGHEHGRGAAMHPHHLQHSRRPDTTATNFRDFHDVHCRNTRLPTALRHLKAFRNSSGACRDAGGVRLLVWDGARRLFCVIWVLRVTILIGRIVILLNCSHMTPTRAYFMYTLTVLDVSASPTSCSGSSTPRFKTYNSVINYTVNHIIWLHVCS
jgi:hypothetical protein